jgi:hypothetical protein
MGRNRERLGMGKETAGEAQVWKAFPAQVKVGRRCSGKVTHVLPNHLAVPPAPSHLRALCVLPSPE